jgi:hypothetical protein
MAGAFGGGLVLAVIVLVIEGTGSESLKLGLRVTARWSFLFFWLSYVGGAMATLFGPAFNGWARRGRQLGLAFAAAQLVHVVLIVWLGIVIGQIPLQGTILWFFLVALFFAYLLMLLSFGAGVRLLGRLWRPLLFLGTTYILIAFGRDFLLGALGEKIQNGRYAVQYVPFAILTLLAVVLRFAAFLQRHFPFRSPA